MPVFKKRPALVLDVFVGFPSYGGNGGISSEVPNIREWWTETLIGMREDLRVGRIYTTTIADTPITMVRNKFVQMARETGAHLLMMVDSDQNPLFWKTDPQNLKPFWNVAFDEIYNHYGQGPLVVGAPYAGPPGGGEPPYVFFWENHGNKGDERTIELKMYPRAVSARMSGVQEAAALPTGMILYDMRAFELIEPSGKGHEQILEELLEGKITKTEAMAALRPGWFDYEWKDGYATEKASTEDVQNTRDISLAGMVKLGYNPVRCAWDCWVGHWKPWMVGKPDLYSVREIAANFRLAVEQNIDRQEKIIEVSSQPGIWKGDGEQMEAVAVNEGGKVASISDIQKGGKITFPPTVNFLGHLVAKRGKLEISVRKKPNKPKRSKTSKPKKK